MNWTLGQTVELCAGPKGNADLLGERTISGLTRKYLVLSSGSKVRHDGTLIGRDGMHIRAKAEVKP